jgi:hypothetical protein
MVSVHRYFVTEDDFFFQLSVDELQYYRAETFHIGQANVYFAEGFFDSGVFYRVLIGVALPVIIPTTLQLHATEAEIAKRKANFRCFLVPLIFYASMLVVFGLTITGLYKD